MNQIVPFHTFIVRNHDEKWNTIEIFLLFQAHIISLIQEIVKIQLICSITRLIISANDNDTYLFSFRTRTKIDRCQMWKLEVKNNSNKSIFHSFYYLN